MIGSIAVTTIQARITIRRDQRAAFLVSFAAAVGPSLPTTAALRAAVTTRPSIGATASVSVAFWTFSPLGVLVGIPYNGRDGSQWHFLHVFSRVLSRLKANSCYTKGLNRHYDTMLSER